MTATYEDQWNELAAAALLGTARRPPPGPLVGPLEAFDAAIDQVAAITCVRRAGLRPLPSSAPVIAPAEDPRPMCRIEAGWRLQEVIEQWPVLIDEWLQLADAGGWRLPPEHVPSLLIRFRTDGRRRASVIDLAGPIALWLIELDLSPVGGGRPVMPAPEPPPMPSDLAVLWGLPGDDLAATLADGLVRGQFANRHRPLLVRLLCDVPADRLPPVIESLNRAGTNASTMGLALTLADLAQTRATMIQELLP